MVSSAYGQQIATQGKREKPGLSPLRVLQRKHFHPREGVPQQHLNCTDAAAEVLGVTTYFLWLPSSCWPERAPGQMVETHEREHPGYTVGLQDASLFHSPCSPLVCPLCSACGSTGIGLTWEGQGSQ